MGKGYTVELGKGNQKVILSWLGGWVTVGNAGGRGAEKHDAVKEETMAVERHG